MSKKSYYELTNFSGWWWNGKRWTKKAKGGCSSHRVIGRDGRRAWRLFRSTPSGHFILLRWYRKGGVRCCEEWEVGYSEKVLD